MEMGYYFRALVVILCALWSPICAQIRVSLLDTQLRVREGEQFNVRVQKTGDITEEVVVVVEISGAGTSDFIGNSQVGRFEAGGGNEASTLFTVRDDTIPELEETYTFTLRVVGGKATIVEPSTASITIETNDDANGKFSFTQASTVFVKEELTLTSVGLEIIRTRGLFGTVTIQLQVSGISDTAVPGEDMTPVIENVVFNEQETQKLVTFQIIPDQIPEDTELFLVSLSSLQPGVSFEIKDKNIGILANDAPIHFAQAEYRVEEGNANKFINIIVNRGLQDDGSTPIGPIDSPATVLYQLISGSALFGQDFNGNNGSIGFSVNATFEQISVQILDDSNPEIEETFQIVLSEPNGDVVITEPSSISIIIIRSDDANGVLHLGSIGQPLDVRFVSEDTEQLINVTIYRSEGAFGDVSVQWEITRSDRSNIDPVTSDLGPSRGVAVFPSQAREATVVISVIQDNTPEPAEKFLFSLLADTLSGGARLEVPLSMEILVKDSDAAYGVVELADNNLQRLVTSTIPRLVEVNIERSGGSIGDVNVTLSVVYLQSSDILDVLGVSNPLTAVLMDGETRTGINLTINPAAFLVVGANFTVQLLSVALNTEPALGAFNSPAIGPRSTTSIKVTAEAANGEIGFMSTQPIAIQEPAVANEIVLQISREGTNGRAIIYWTAVGINTVNSSQVTDTDILLNSGSVTMESGMSLSHIRITVLPDDEPETDEVISVTLARVEPVETQRLRPGAATVQITIRENDNPGGTFQFSPTMNDLYTAQEEGSPVDLLVVRTGGALLTRRVEYYITPDGEEEFYGSANVLVFEPGVMLMNASVVARGDGIPELTESFTIRLRSYGLTEATLGSRTVIRVSVPPNDDPYGLIHFADSPAIAFVNESTGADIQSVSIMLVRSGGTFGNAIIGWELEGDSVTNPDFSTHSGSVTFGPAQTRGYVILKSEPDDIPEPAESFTVRLSISPSSINMPRLGEPQTAIITINQNDHPVYFKGPNRVIYDEPSQVALTVVRDGDPTFQAQVKYRTLDGTARQQDGDFTGVFIGTVNFDFGESEKIVTIDILDDTLPESDEEFGVELFDPQGDIVVSGQGNVTIVILANDDAGGVFNLDQPISQQATEGQLVIFNVVRERGDFGIVSVFWEVYQNTSVLGSADENLDFLATSGSVVFVTGQTRATISLSPISDGVPELSETFHLVLLNVTGDIDGQNGRLGDPDLLTGYIEVAPNDDPNGLFGIHPGFAEVTVAEDFLPGSESSATTSIVIERKQGSYGTVEVMWELSSSTSDSYTSWDLLLLGNIPPEVEPRPNMRRPRSGTIPYFFDGGEDSFVSVPASEQPTAADLTRDGFTISAWFIPFADSNSYIMAKTSADGLTYYYSLKMRTSVTSASLEFRYSAIANVNRVAAGTTSENIQNGEWHNAVVTVEAGVVSFYLDGRLVGNSSLLSTVLLDEDNGQLLIGAPPTGGERFIGHLQDIQIIPLPLTESAIKERYDQPTQTDLSPVSGTVQFGDGVREASIQVTSVPDEFPEPEEGTQLRLVSVRGGGRIDTNNSTALITVQKSDNANGLFNFSGSCDKVGVSPETLIMSCPVDRLLGNNGLVVVTWVVVKQGDPATDVVVGEFVNTTGDIVFEQGEIFQTINLTVSDDLDPELVESFDVVLTSATAMDNQLSSTPTSGASIAADGNRVTIVIEENDYPYGLLQFSSDGIAPAPNDPIIPPALNQPQVHVSEEAGTVTLMVVRAQGSVGRVSVEWRAEDGTARSSGVDPDYEAAGGRLDFSEGQRFATFDIKINDNNIPEDDKVFYVQLLNPTGGAGVDVGSRVTVVIDYSDGAYGIFQFRDDSLGVSASEVGDVGFNTVTLTVVRLSGRIGVTTVHWEVTGDTDNDLVSTAGTVDFLDGQAESQLELQIRSDTLPELDHRVTVRLVNVSKGELGAVDKLSSLLTIEANDSPYGVFTIPSANRPLSVTEGFKNVTVSVRRLFGTKGIVDVDYQTLTPSETYAFISPVSARANFSDFTPASGTIRFSAGQVFSSLIISLLDDDIPEEAESVYVRLTDVRLIQGEQPRPVPSSPSLEQSSLTYAQIVIQSNDNANGILELSPQSITVNENHQGPVLNVIRKGGLFGEIVVKYKITDGTTVRGQDYSEFSTDVVLSEGESTKPLLVEIKDDNIPELAEYFTIELLGSLTGGAVLGNNTVATVTIAPSDDPSGAFSFASEGVSLSEPPNGQPRQVNVSVIRSGGSMGVVMVYWEATFNNSPPASEIDPVSDVEIFVSNEAQREITITVFPDDIPEEQKDIQIRLTRTSAGARIGDRDVFILSILPNDNPHGLVMFSQEAFTTEERDRDSTQYLTISRIGGKFGELRVYYQTHSIDLLTEVSRNGSNVYSYYSVAKLGRSLQPSTVANITGHARPLDRCAEICLLSESCAAFQFSSSTQICETFITADLDNLQSSTDTQYYTKDISKARFLYDLSSTPNDDYRSVSREPVIIQNGADSAVIPINILADNRPELDEKFIVELTSIELVGRTPVNIDDTPKFGTPTSAEVVILANDNAQGVFSIYSANPSAENGGSLIVVPEQGRLSVDLVIDRQGGSIGEVTISWDVDLGNSTATAGQDYRADGAQLRFLDGDERTTITVSILEDSIPEDDETIVIQLVNPEGGATISANQSVTIVIQANDNVAGVFGIYPLSIVTEEGQTVDLLINRTSPGLGVVTVDWQILGVDGSIPNTNLNKFQGQLVFQQGELSKTVSINVLRDQLPELNEQYEFKLMSIATQGVRDSGAASIHPQQGTATISIKGSDDPHGVISFSSTSLDVRVQEGEANLKLFVDRKFGSSGTLRVEFEAGGGYLHQSGPGLDLATPVDDFTPEGRYIYLEDGENTGFILIRVINDQTPEIDEALLVNLTSVTLVGAVATLPPRLADKDIRAQVTISANDGTQGTLGFPPNSSRVSVSESNTTITLTVVRSGGTFGNVSVRYFSQPQSNSVVRDADFSLNPQFLFFSHGEDTKTIMVYILEDDLPEPDEDFLVILDSPQGGVAVGENGQASVTILANDDAGGFVTFDLNDSITLTEPRGVNLADSIASFRLLRGPGIFGVINVPFVVKSSNGTDTSDLTPVSGYITFQDRQLSAVLEIRAVEDEIPEIVEQFHVTLQTPIGGAQLGAIQRRTIIIRESDAPYGLLQIYPAGTRNSFLDVEESAGLLHFDIIRSQGLQGTISVDVLTQSGTASVSGNSTSFTMATIQSFPTQTAHRWFAFTFLGNTFGLMLTTTAEDVTSPVIGGGVLTPWIGRSVLYEWKEGFQPIQGLETNGATSAVTFVQGGITYVVITNRGTETRRETPSKVYRVNNNASLSVIQDLSSVGAEDVAYFSSNGQSFLVIANGQSSLGHTVLDSLVYVWDNGRSQFSTTPWQLIGGRGAKAVEVFVIGGEIFLAVANHYDSDTQQYEIESVILKLQSNNKFALYQYIPTQGCNDVKHVVIGGDDYLILANEMLDDNSLKNLSSVIYKWDKNVQSFQMYQNLATDKAQAVQAFTGPDQNAYIIFADAVSNSTVYIWDITQLKFIPVWHARAASHVSVITVNHPTDPSVLLTLSNPNTNPGSTLYQVTMVRDSDFIPRTSTLTFAPGETMKQSSVVVLEDDIPEDTETFYVSLSNPQGGAEIGANQKAAINILSNDNAHGIIEFSQDSLDRREAEIPRQDNMVQLTVIRYRGNHGRVVVRWRMTGDQSIQDITPQAGLLTFSPGENIAIISLVIKDDLIPELAELTFVTLETVVEPGTVLPTRGAVIGPKRVARVTVLASDSPHGVVYWESAEVDVAEPEGTDSTVLLNIVREQGTLGDISISYRTSQASEYGLEEQAASGQDYVATQGSIVMRDGETKATIPVQLLRDDIPELGEVFLVNLISVTLLTGTSAVGAGPSIRDPGNKVAVTILENDSARGLVLFDVITNTEGRLDTYEAYGRNNTFSLKVRRVTGYFGTVLVDWQVYHRDTTVTDLTPSSGVLRFAPGVREGYIYITILDDNIFEPMEQFDVKLIGVSEGAKLGAISNIRVAVLKNDSPRGLFGFDSSELFVQESTFPNDPDGKVTLSITRLVGTEGVVPVQWRLNAEAQNDFDPPRSGTLIFQPGEAQKTVTLSTRPDTTLEGEERFVVSLVSAEDADISSDNGDITIVISPDPGSSGTVSIVKDYRMVYIGEPGESSPTYRGQVEIVLTRGAGIFNGITVTWSITPRDVTAFAQLEGTVVFSTLQERASIKIQARDDVRPELSSMYSLQLTSATGGAVISTETGASVSDIMFVASDYPHGLFQFPPPAETPVEENEGFVDVAIMRDNGNVGRVEVTYITSAGTALANQDFIPRAGVLVFENGQTTQTVRIEVVQDSLPEGPEQFYVNITAVRLLVPNDNDYTDVGGLTVDMKPGIGPSNMNTIVIDKSDDAEGVLQFDPTALQTTVKEEAGLAQLTVTRVGGSYGRVGVRYLAQNLTATAGVDYSLTPGEVTFEDGVSVNTINVTLIDDLEREAAETFTVVLTSATGGAQLGSITTATVTIAKSDYPNGRFGFRGSTNLLLVNPTTEITQDLAIQRSGGLLGQQTLSWRILGPNDPTLVLQDTSDIAYRVNNIDVTLGTLQWADGEGGEKEIRLFVKPHDAWEIQKVFVVEIYDIIGAPNGVGNGEKDPQSSKITITIQKFGHPNGIVEFGEVAQTPRTVDEPSSSTFALRFPILRRPDTGVLGNIMIYWEVIGPADKDILETSGSVALGNGVRSGEIILQILPDNVPELTENFELKLSRLEGGAEISSTHNTSIFSISFNDNPHGVFGVDSVDQSVIIDPLTNQRRLLLNITREAGTFGPVQVFYSIKYDQPQLQSGIGVEQTSGTVTFQDGDQSASTMVTVVGDGFLETGSTFSLSLVGSPLYLGADVTQPPSLIAGQTDAKVVVPEEVGNTEVGFLYDIVNVNEVTNFVEVTLTRRGLFGTVEVRVESGFPAGQQPVGFESGEITPDIRTVTLPQGEKSRNVTFQLTGKRDVREIFALHLPQNPTTAVVGGARLWPGKSVTQIDPAGVIGFTPDSREVIGSELAGQVNLTVERLYGSQDRVEAQVEVRGGNASSTSDFRLLRNSVVLEVGQTSAILPIQLLTDSYPERAEDFNLVITRVEKFPTVTTQELSPRISALYGESHVVIKESNDPYGLLSVDQVSAVEESNQDITVTIRRTGGSYGSVNVAVRTVGGNEVWSSEIAVQEGAVTKNTIGEVLGDTTTTPAIGGRDYEILDTTLYFADGESVKTVTVTILDDQEAEPVESFYVYLTQPQGGARIATGAPDGGLKGYTAVEIKANDYSNGLVGFTDLSLFVTANEDVTSPVIPLQLQRLNAFYGTLQVFWKVKFSLTSSSVQDDLLRGQVSDLNGVVNCPAGEEICPLNIPLKDDQTPEESQSFLVILDRVGADAVLDADRSVSNVTVMASDYVRGLIQFLPEFSLIHVDKDTKTVRLEVSRLFGSRYTVEVEYATVQLPSAITVSGVEIYPALPTEDYLPSSGKLTFPSNSQMLQYINLTLTPLMSRSNQYPKQVFIRLSNPTNGASLHNKYFESVVRIVDKSELPVWEAVKISIIGSLDNKNIVQVFDQLERTVNEEMGENEGILVEDVLQAITDKGLTQKFPDTTLKPRLFDIFCKLLDPSKGDSRRGHNSYRRLLENFAYGLVVDRPCPYPIPPELETYQCQNVKLSAGRWGINNLTGFNYQAQYGDNYVVPSKINGMTSNSIQNCVDLHLIEYNSEEWFYQADQTGPVLLNSRIVSFGIKGRDSSYSDVPARYRIHTPNRALAPRRSQCVYFDESSKKWSGDVCQVTNDFDLDVDDFVDCSCNHLTSYAVRARVSDNTGYLVWFYVACFICIIGLSLTIINHHVFSILPRFSVCLLMHMCFACLATQICYVIAAFFSPTDILVSSLDQDNGRCIAMGLFLHYFFLAQFTWIITQAINFWKILVMNDEHTDRKYAAFFLMGWATPAVIVALFYVIVYNVYKYVYNLPFDFIYGDVGNAGEICFITNALSAMGGVILPAILLLLGTCVVFIQAFQLTPQWKAYDDVYKGRHNYTEVRILLGFWLLIIVTWIWGGLHLAYRHLWMLILFCLFNIAQGLYALIVYAILRNTCFPCTRPQKASYSLGGGPLKGGIHPYQPTSQAPSIKGSRASLINESWERESITPSAQMKVRRTLPSNTNIYVTPPVLLRQPHDPDIQDFDDLLFALKTGGPLTPSDISKSPDLDNLSIASSKPANYEMKRISITDTHL